MAQPGSTPGSGSSFTKWMVGIGILLVLALPLVYSAIVVPLSPSAQAEASLAMIALAILASFSRSLRPLIIFLSCFASMRYFYWRISYTLNVNGALDGTVSALLLGAEVYGLLILLLGYFQTIEFVERRPPPLRSGPAVDVFIPTYNEPVDIVRRTLIGALAIDYPSKTVYVLDDGRRPEIEAMTAEYGGRYIARPDNRHAKAGNLNHALGRTTGELIAIFDADHVPVRGFLASTLPFFEDPKVALVQAQQHFFNPDPYERNLNLTGRVAPEQNFFYQVIQPGNDFWNSAFFCGSCAVVRRSALDAIGGLKTRTVTEDAHTALELHARGYHSVYVNQPLAAGLATETFAAHVKQRMRWARGMAQILRLDCPLIKRGLSIPQRLNYFNAMVHFFFGIPRLILILAPLMFLYFGVHPIRADAFAVLAYIFPHIGLSTIANSTISKRARHSFWAAVYEVSIAPYTAGVTLLAMLNPRLGRFNVTDKGTNIAEARFDLRTSWFTMALLAVSMFGLVVAFPLRLYNYSRFGIEPGELDSILFNSFWVFGNLVVLVAAACVGLEQPQQRRSPRVKRKFRCEISPGGVSFGAGGPGRPVTRAGNYPSGAGFQPAPPDRPQRGFLVSSSGTSSVPLAAASGGDRVEATTLDLSEAGVRVWLPGPIPLPGEARLAIRAPFGVSVEVPARLVRYDWAGRGRAVEAAFEFLSSTPDQLRSLVQIIFSGDDGWRTRDYPEDSVFRSLWYLVTTFWRATAPRRQVSSRAPELHSRWRAWLDGRECICTSISGDGAVTEPPNHAAGQFSIELQAGKTLQAARLADGTFEWAAPQERREFWAALYNGRPAGRKLARRALLGSLGLMACAAKRKAELPEVLEESWKAYKARFIQADGRVIDHRAAGVSTSEGQAYAMLRAAWVGDRDAFDRVHQWARNNLNAGVRKDRLWAWKWGKDAHGKWHALDPAFASDADQDAALALLLALHLWNDGAYLNAARAMLADLWKRAAVSAGGSTYLLAGDSLCKGSRCRVNPSYYAPYAYRIFAKHDPDHDWRRLVDSGYSFLERASSLTATRLPPDWLYLDSASGSIEAGDATESSFSYDAFRVYWRVALDAVLNGESRAERYLRATLGFVEREWRKHGRLPAVVGADGAARARYESLDMLAGLMPAMQFVAPDIAEAMARKVKAAYHGGLWADNVSYYLQNWAWFGTALYQRTPAAVLRDL